MQGSSTQHLEDLSISGILFNWGNNPEMPEGMGGSHPLKLFTHAIFMNHDQV